MPLGDSVLENFLKFFHILGGKKNKLVSKYQTQAVELKNAIGGPRLTFFWLDFFSDGPLVIKTKLADRTAVLYMAVYYIW